MKRTLGWILAVLVAAGLGMIFGRWAFVPPTVETQADAPATVAVTDMTIGSSIPVPLSVTWGTSPFGVGAAQGVVTSLAVADGDWVYAGQELYTVDLWPVVAAVGEIPAFRDLSIEATGRDVIQLQQMLADLGFFSGPVNGIFGASTRNAVMNWQQSLGLPRDGIVHAGDIVFTPSLPVRVQLVDDMTVGSRIHEGQQVLNVLADEPEFAVFMQQGPATLDANRPFVVDFDGESIAAVTAENRSDPFGNASLLLARQEGGPICADRCELISLENPSAGITARQVTVENVSGPGVPAAAVHFTALGQPYLLTEAGDRVDIQVLGQGDGRVIVAGVDSGTVVRLVDSTAPATQQSAESS